MSTNISKDASDRITVSSPYDPQFVLKVKSIDGRKWHLSSPVIARHKVPKQSLYNFEGLRRELILRK
jgi:hypothetical protein